MDIRSRHRIKTSFTFISLADIVLLLLIFFLLSSTFIVQPGIRVRLPKAITRDAEIERNISITLLGSGEIYLEDEPLDIAKLPGRIYQRLLEQPGQLIVLRADREVPLERAVEILDIAKGAGGEKFIIATQPKVE